ncbi:MAG: hypothetical protein ABSC37_18420, partial [Xanthobacteraceae bacterium]
AFAQREVRPKMLSQGHPQLGADFGGAGGIKPCRGLRFSSWFNRTMWIVRRTNPFLASNSNPPIFFGLLSFSPPADLRF